MARDQLLDRGMGLCLFRPGVVIQLLSARLVTFTGMQLERKSVGVFISLIINSLDRVHLLQAWES